MSSVAKFYFKPSEGEHVETTVNLDHEKAAAVCGTVRDREGAAVENALVLLFRSGQEKKLIDRQFTDDEGQFSFGPIEGNVLYLIKVYKNSIKIRELEIIADQYIKSGKFRRSAPFAERRLTFPSVFSNISVAQTNRRRWRGAYRYR